MRRSARVICVAALAGTALLAGTAGGVARADDSLDDGQPGPGEKWVPGELLVRFDDGVDAAERQRIADQAGIHLGTELPLVPNLWEAETVGHVDDAVEKLFASQGV